MNTPKWSEVFVAGGFPKYTYYSRSTRRLEERITEAGENLCKLVIVTGHTKSGKTVLVQKVYPRKDALWVDGGAVTDEQDFWDFIIEQMELHNHTKVSDTESFGSEVTGDVSAEANALIAKGGAKVGSALKGETTSSTTRERSVSSKIAVLEALKNTETPLVIDDFHYLPSEIQAKIIRALKPVVYEGVPVIIIAIPHRLYDAVSVEREMGGRVSPVKIPLWEVNELATIPKSGFNILNSEIDDALLRNICEQSLGSPHLIQDFCRALCRFHSPNVQGQFIQLEADELSTLLQETAESIGRPIFDKLARGPRQRSDRKIRELKNGSTADIYKLVLLSLANLKPGLVTLEYEDIRSSIREICKQKDIPTIQEIARVLGKMSEIAATDKSSTPVIDFNESEKRVHITDPFFAFYLRWGDFELN